MDVLQRIDNKRTKRISHITNSHKTLLGQYLTPDIIARFMSSLSVKYSTIQNTKILDPGAGQGILFCSLVEQLASNNSQSIIQIDAYEIDPSILADLEHHSNLISEKYPVQVNVYNKDFLETFSSNMTWDGETKYTHIIMNPPYKKLNVTSSCYRHLAEIGIETVNYYSAFVALSIRLLEHSGILVAILPRSFCNGPYFLSFRKQILNTCTIRHIHSFKSRSEAFKEESVLQENIIIVLEKGKHNKPIVVSTSSDRKLTDYTETVFDDTSIIHKDDKQLFINIPINTDKQDSFIFTYSLSDLGISVSTGPIVDFRMKEKLHMSSTISSTPLLYPMHFKNGECIWPVESKKPNSIQLDDNEVAKLTFSSGFYVVVKRFSSKEEKRRIWASIINNTDFNGRSFTVENHLNIFHSSRNGLNKDTAIGLFIFLNTDYVDLLFRNFSGHTQVNATDLRNMKYPSISQLAHMAKIMESDTSLSFDNILRKMVEINADQNK